MKCSYAQKWTVYRIGFIESAIQKRSFSRSKSVLLSYFWTTKNGLFATRPIFWIAYLYTYNANLFALSEEGGRTDDPRQKVYKIKELANSRDQVLEPQVGT